jgi:glycolate oxidase FAD binding subunit
MNRWAGQPLPISATAWHDGLLWVRLSGANVAVQAAAGALGGSPVDDTQGFWRDMREHKHAFFASNGPLWRLALPSATAPLQLQGRQLIEWGGGLRWLSSGVDAAQVRELAHRSRGHATLFRAAEKTAGAFAPLDPILLRLHRALKSAFDPAGIFNPGRMYAEL